MRIINLTQTEHTDLATDFDERLHQSADPEAYRAADHELVWKQLKAQVHGQVPVPNAFAVLFGLECAAAETITAWLLPDQSWYLEIWNGAQRKDGVPLPDSHPGAKTLQQYRSMVILHPERNTQIEQCRKCGGSGLWTHDRFPRLLRAGRAVVCRQCHGSGATLHQYEDFTGRREVPDVDTVLARGTVENYRDSHVGGIPYENWLNDPTEVHQTGHEARDQSCPAMWYQGLRVVIDWEECQEVETFTNCPLYGQKAKCWDRYDAEGPNAATAAVAQLAEATRYGA